MFAGGLVGGYGINGFVFQWTDWVTLVLLWALMLVAIIAIAMHIAHHKGHTYDDHQDQNMG